MVKVFMNSYDKKEGQLVPKKMNKVGYRTKSQPTYSIKNTG